MIPSLIAYPTQSGQSEIIYTQAALKRISGLYLHIYAHVCMCIIIIVKEKDTIKLRGSEGGIGWGLRKEREGKSRSDIIILWWKNFLNNYPTILQRVFKLISCSGYLWISAHYPLTLHYTWYYSSFMNESTLTTSLAPPLWYYQPQPPGTHSHHWVKWHLLQPHFLKIKGMPPRIPGSFLNFLSMALDGALRQLITSLIANRSPCLSVYDHQGDPRL